MMSEVLGMSLPRLDGVLKVTGAAGFCEDLALPGMLHGKILRSPHPHARILNIDKSRAERLPGVRAVITGEDTLGLKYGTIPDEYPIAMDAVRYVGDEVAAVAALSEDAAREAHDLIKVDYELLPAVFDPLAAMEPGAPRVHDVERNIARHVKMSFGDVEKGFAESDYIFEDRFETQMVNHCTMETHGALAHYDASGKLTIWSSTQAPFLLRMSLSEVLALPLGKIRVIKPKVGGAFGGKREMLAADYCAALLSRKTGKPVKIILSREEELTSTRQRHPLIVELKTGVKKGGSLMAKQCRAIMDNGAYNARGPDVIGSCPSYITILYRVHHIKFDGYLVYTNKPVGSAMRGFGNPQMRFADDSQMDIIAEKLGVDPVELRLINARESGDITPSKVKITSCGLKESITRSAQASGYREKRRKMGPYRGIGLASGHHVCGFKSFLPHDSSAAVIKINEDGTVNLLTGAADVGQGEETVLAQIAAAELGVEVEKVEVTAGDTEVTPMDLGSWGSRGTLVAGRAVKAAAADAKRQIFEVVAQELEVSPEDIEAIDGSIRVKGSPSKALPFKEAVALCSNSSRGIPIVGRGHYNTPCDRLNRQTGEGNSAPAYSFGTQVAEVEVDRLTGKVKVLKVTAAIDCGFAINPLSVEGQVEGSIVGGIGQALLEDFSRDGGHILNPNFLDYKLPLTCEAPQIDTIIVRTHEPEGPFGAKGVGEFVQIPTAAAIANAVYDAIGVRIKSLPMTPEDVLKAIEEKKATAISREHRA